VPLQGPGLTVVGIAREGQAIPTIQACARLHSSPAVRPPPTTRRAGGHWTALLQHSRLGVRTAMRHDAGSRQAERARRRARPNPLTAIRRVYVSSEGDRR
jgi:hypothetical protein